MVQEPKSKRDPGFKAGGNAVMAAQRRQSTVVLCAALTADGKLDESSLVLPQILLRGGGSSGRHPWALSFDQASAVIVDQELAEALELTQKLVQPLLVIASGQTLERELAKLRIARIEGLVWCFGGAALCRTLLEAGAADELRLCIRPKIDGRRGSASLSGAGGDFFPASVACRLLGLEVVGDECFLHYRVRRQPARSRQRAAK